MNRSIFAALAVAAAMFVPAAASAQSLLDRLQPSGAAKKAAGTCASENLEKDWIITFEKDGDPVLCSFSVKKNGRLEDGVCGVKTLVAAAAVRGMLQISSGCAVSGDIKIHGIGKLSVLTQMAADKSTMAGFLFNSNNFKFFPLAVTEWLPTD